MERGHKQSQYHHTYDNKQNIKINRKPQNSQRHRNDHSIQAKSPIKIPSCSLKKDDLTFRLKTEPFLHSAHQQQPQPLEQKQRFSCNLTLTSIKQMAKLNFNTQAKAKRTSKQESLPRQKIIISEDECRLVDNLWEICNRLRVMQNQYLRDSLDVVYVEVRKMLALIGQNGINQEAPLASSKKIKLQNYIAHSHCEKEIFHKEFQSGHQWDQSENLQFSSSRILSQQKIIQNPESRTKTQSNGQNDLQMKKIMFILDGKQRNIAQKSITEQDAKISSERLSSMSSFNQNSSDDSGFTVFQIERCSERISRCSKNERGTQNSEQESRNVKSSHCQIFSSGRGSKVSQNQQAVGGVGNKRKVLNDIVAMLNQKYKKNIKLQ